MQRGKRLHYIILYRIGVLILVNKYVTKLVGIFLDEFGVFLKQQVRLQQQVVEIHSIGCQTLAHIRTIYVHHLVTLGVGIVGVLLGGFVLFGRNEVVFRTADAAAHRAEVIKFVIEVHILDDSLYNIFGIGGVVYGKILLIISAFDFPAEDFHKDGMERAHPQLRGILFADLLGDTLLHLPRRLVGEGDGEDVPRLVTAIEKVHYLVREHTGLAGARSRNHKSRSVDVFHRCALRVVKFV